MSVVLVTGARTGLGRATALAFARHGHRVVATMRGPDPTGDDLQEQARSEGLDLSVVALDVTDPASVAAAVDRTVADCGRLDVVVNNAGFLLAGPAEALADDELLRQFDTNVVGVLRVVRAVAPVLRTQGAGTIVNISSIAGLVGVPFEAAYSASKWALEGFSESLRFELAGSGVRVLLVEPGSHASAFHDNAVRAAAFTVDHPLWAAYEGFRAAMRSSFARGPAEDFADALVKLVEDPGAPFRTVIGEDARGVAELKRTLTQAEFDAWANQLLGVAVPE
jgi:NAD(P)-dependent dehydrogenase (short-subunit alcohol dehydrogenase family)